MKIFVPIFLVAVVIFPFLKWEGEFNEIDGLVLISGEESFPKNIKFDMYGGSYTAILNESPDPLNRGYVRYDVTGKGVKFSRRTFSSDVEFLEDLDKVGQLLLDQVSDPNSARIVEINFGGYGRWPSK